MRTFQSRTFSASSFRRQLGGVAVLSLAIPGPGLLMDNSDGNTEVVITTAHTAPLTGITGIAHLRPGLPSGARKAVMEAVSSAGESRERSSRLKIIQCQSWSGE